MTAPRVWVLFSVAGVTAPRVSCQARNGKRKGRKPPMASVADRHDLYQRSVQEPEPDLLFINRVFRSHFDRPARLLREDFCGTAATACFWVQMNKENRAIGIDLDGLSREKVQALRVPLKVTIHILVMIIASLLTKPTRREALDRFYVKMKTPTEIDPGKDREELELSYAEPDRYDYKKLFPGTALEFQRPGRADIAGFALSCLGVVGVILLALWVAGLGA